MGLGSKIGKYLMSSVRTPIYVVFDRFFASPELIHELDHCAVGTVMTNRKYITHFFKARWL